MRVVVTGGAGFIGSNLAKHFANKGDEVLVIDCFRGTKTFANGNLTSFGHFANLQGFAGEIYCGDLCDAQTMWKIRHFSPEAIFHQAAVSDTTVSEQNEVMRVNLNTFSELLDIACEFNAPLIYASSGAVYGSQAAPQKVGVESPRNVYGFSKLMMDKTAAIWRERKPNLKAVGLRYFNVYGEGEFHKNSTASMVLQFGLQMLKSGKARLFEGSDKILRDFVYVGDVVRANEAALSWQSGVYNVGTGVARSFLEVAQIVRKELGVEAVFEEIKNPFTKQYQFHTCAELNGFESAFSLEEGIRRYAPNIREIFEESVR